MEGAYLQGTFERYLLTAKCMVCHAFQSEFYGLTLNSIELQHFMVNNFPIDTGDYTLQQWRLAWLWRTSGCCDSSLDRPVRASLRTLSL